MNQGVEGKVESVWPKAGVKWPVRLLAFCLVLIMISCIGASLLQSSFGKVDVIKFKIPSTNGSWISGQLFKPEDASEENKVPIVIAAAGYMNNNQMQHLNAIELSRRGIAVITFDSFFHGESSRDPKNGDLFETIADNALGMIPMVEFASDLDYVDSSKIGITGHSQGGMCTLYTMMHYAKLYQAALEEAKLPESDEGEKVSSQEQKDAIAVNKISAALINSFTWGEYTDEFFEPLHTNLGFIYGKYDEGCYSTTNGNGDITGDCDISLGIINSGLADDEKITFAEEGKYYGDAQEKTLRVVFNPPITHIAQTFSSETVADTVDFFVHSFNIDNPIPLNNQIWNIKEIFNFMGLIGCLLMVIPLGVLLLRIPVFVSLKSNIPKKLPSIKGNKRANMLFWGTWMMLWIISGVTFMPFTNLDAILFPDGPVLGNTTSVFSQHGTNFIMIWTVLNGIVGLILFYIFYRSVVKKAGMNIETLGVKISILELIKTISLAVSIFIGFYAMLMFAQYFFNTDFRLWLLAITPFNSDSFCTALLYMPFFFIYFIANSLLLNGTMRVEGMKNWKTILLGAFGSVLGLLIVIIIQYGTLFTTGVIYFDKQAMDWLHIVVALPLVPMLFISNYFSRYFFKATGKVWLGAIVNTLILVMITVANTATIASF